MRILVTSGAGFAGSHYVQTLRTNVAGTHGLADRSMIRHVPDRKGRDLRYALGWQKIRDELGYRPRHPFAAGLATTVSWYRENPGWWDK